MMVKIFDNDNKYDLQREINNWLENISSDTKVIDIKFSGNGNRAPYSIDHWSAMVIYER